MSCGVGTALIWPLAWELPYAVGAALKKKKKKEGIKCKWKNYLKLNIKKHHIENEMEKNYT